jgi:uncharacterized protein YjaZ
VKRDKKTLLLQELKLIMPKKHRKMQMLQQMPLYRKKMRRHGQLSHLMIMMVFNIGVMDPNAIPQMLKMLVVSTITHRLKLHTEAMTRKSLMLMLILRPWKKKKVGKKKSKKLKSQCKRKKN